MVGSPDFMSALTRADIFACAYGYVYSEALHATVPCVSLVGSDGEGLTEAFREFQRWSDESQTEAVDLNFVFLEEGGYLLGIAPRMESLRRSLGYADFVHEPLFVSGTWIKKLDTDTSARSFRRYYECRFVAPFMLTAGSHPPSKSPLDADMNLVRSVPGAAQILMFRTTFADEASVGEGTQPAMMVRTHRARKEKTDSANQKMLETLPPPRSTTPADYFRRRALCLKRHFPVTLERIRKLDAHREAIQALEAIGVRRWQCEQALCNLVLSASMCDGGFHYLRIRQGHLRNSIFQALQGRFEEADGVEAIPPRVSPRLLQDQVELDAASLLKEGGGDPKGLDLDRLQQLLAQRGLLDASG